ncbi:MAG: PglZ domain-containing protein [Bacteroidales bacterium]|jgi:DNA-binding response OmpR family regulator|nr:PglZ domain-containing protein [Bacteroidales bacterium]
MKKTTILWADDEIELLKPHILFLESKGYEVIAVNNGNDAIEESSNPNIDIVFLDEQMPGITGLEALEQIKRRNPNVPVVMITKSEAEDIMEAAIGAHINDYLIKPVNPHQILLSIKKNLDQKDIITQTTTQTYQAEFSQLGMQIASAETWQDWIAVHKELTHWETKLSQSKDRAMNAVFVMQKNDADVQFAKFIKRNYISWLNTNNPDKPLLSPNVVKEKIVPLIKSGRQTLMLLIDNLRYDHWCNLRPLLSEYYNITEDSQYYSILPTCTQYARNSIFAGLMPLDIEKMYPELWKNDDDEDEAKNRYEEELLATQLKRLGYTEKFFFEKITSINPGRRVVDKLQAIQQHQFSVIVYNFVDTLSHARTEMDMIKELAADEAAYRSLTYSWFTHSTLFELLQELSSKHINIVITTDHGSVRVQNPIKVLADKSVTSNLRYKQGKALNYNPKEVFEIKKPHEAHLPMVNLSSTYIFATNQDFFAYPNNFNYYAKYYRDSFQHGGVSLDEIIIPCVHLQPKR